MSVQAKKIVFNDIQGKINLRRILYIKKAIWLYFLLLIFEGALRKWVVPGLAGPLLIVRDPVAIYMIFLAIRAGVFPKNLFNGALTMLTILTFIFTFLAGHGNVFVAIYGLRIFVLHFPLIFIIGRVFDYDDMVKIGRAILIINILMTLLVAVQFYSPQSAWVNRGVGGEGDGSGFSGGGGFYRVPGTFSFTSGLSAFYSFTAPFIFYFWFNGKNQVPKYLLWASTFALIAAVPLSISRTVLFSIGITFIFSLFLVSQNKRTFSRMLGAAIAIVMLFGVLQQFAFFQTASGAFTDRFTSANKSEGGAEGIISNRIIGYSLLSAFDGDIPPLGYGLGAGSNVGAQLLTGGTMVEFSEGEWGRLTRESGMILGVLFILTRVFFTLRLASVAYKNLRQGNIMPWLILSYAFVNIIQGTLSQPNALGFVVLAGGFLIAGMDSNTKKVFA
ncbi:hypothetical protein ACLI08_00275 [Flavobacterium sp. RNTU_13]|uniref:hypothetical protein n=1 Tax=Flavobacterium sp. RNTU_13 TaxID=3375145 RepID=UPI0039860F46